MLNEVITRYCRPCNQHISFLVDESIHVEAVCGRTCVDNCINIVTRWCRLSCCIWHRPIRLWHWLSISLCLASYNNDLLMFRCCSHVLHCHSQHVHEYCDVHTKKKAAERVFYKIYKEVKMSSQSLLMFKQLKTTDESSKLCTAYNSHLFIKKCK